VRQLHFYAPLVLKWVEAVYINQWFTQKSISRMTLLWKGKVSYIIMVIDRMTMQGSIFLLTTLGIIERGMTKYAEYIVHLTKLESDIILN